jgi:hypothetical protein
MPRRTRHTHDQPPTGSRVGVLCGQSRRAYPLDGRHSNVRLRRHLFRIFFYLVTRSFNSHDLKSTVVWQTVLAMCIFSSLVSCTRMLTYPCPSNVHERTFPTPSLPYQVTGTGACSTDALPRFIDQTRGSPQVMVPRCLASFLFAIRIYLVAALGGSDGS